MYHWKQKLSHATLEWESRFNTKSRDYNELRNNYASLDKTFKESQTKLNTLESQVQEHTSLTQKLSEEKNLLSNQLKKYEVSTLEFQKTISNLEEVKLKHQETLPLIEANQQEIEKHKKEAEVLAKQKKELTGVVNGLKDYRTRYEDAYLQLTKQKKVLESAQESIGKLEQALILEREEGPKVLELSGKLRWVQSEKELLLNQLAQMELWMERAAFDQLRGDAEHVLFTEKAAKDIDTPVSTDTVIQTYQVKLWEKEGALRWAEDEKLGLVKKIEELEYAGQSLTETRKDEKPIESVEAEKIEDLTRSIGVDQNGKLTHLAMELEETLEEKHSLSNQLAELNTQLEGLLTDKESLSQLTQSQRDTIDELTGRFRWNQLAETELKQTNSDLKEKLDIRFDQLEKEKEQTLKLAESLKLRENEFLELEKRFASEQVAQALIESEEMDEMKMRLDELLSTTYQAAEDHWNHLAENSRLSLSLKQAEAYVGQYASEIEQLKRHEAENKAELISLFDQVQSLQETAYSAAQSTTDHEAENVRLAHSVKGLEDEIEVLSEIKEQKEALESELSDLRESAYSAAQSTIDHEAENVRLAHTLKGLKDEIEVLSEVKGQKEALEKELSNLRESAYSAAQITTDHEAENVRLAYALKGLRDEIEVLGEIEGQKEALESELSDLRESAHLAAQEQIDKEAENLRISLRTKSLEEELMNFKGIESEKESLTMELEELRSTAYAAAKQQVDDEGALIRQTLNLQQMSQQLAGIQQETEKEKELLKEEIKILSESMDASEKGRMEHQKKVEELEKALNQTKDQLAEIRSQKDSDNFLLHEFSGTQTLLEEEKDHLTRQVKELRQSAQLAAQQSADNLGELSRMQLELAKAKREIHTLEGEMQDGASQIQQLQAQMIQQDKQHTREVEEMEEALKLSEAQLEMDQIGESQKAEELAQRIAELEEALKSAQTEKAQKNLRIAQLETRVAALSQNEQEDFPAFPNNSPATVSFALELTEEEKDHIRQRIFQRRGELELNYGRMGIASSSERDDLTQIEGIDAFTEERLNLIQIYCFGQIANFSDEEVNSITESLELTPGIITQKNWIQQAKKLKKK